MQQLSIGAFSRLTHLSVKTLRYYHEVGLIEPAIVDPDSGYRYYRPGQAPTAQLVRRFRDLGLPVTDVKAVLDAPDLAARDTILAGHLDRMREQLRQTEAAVDSLRRLLGGASEPVGITERDLPGAVTVSIGGRINRADIAAWWWESLHALPAIAARAGLRPSGPPGGLYDDDRFAQDEGEARVYLPVHDTALDNTAALDDTGARWDLPSGRFAVAQFQGPHGDSDRTYAALGTYAAQAGRDGVGPVREHYLTGLLDTPDVTRWCTELCWPLAG
jgi:DNA-binding transcriptional MerR regulator/effector-binding domain-containing protein